MPGPEGIGRYRILDLLSSWSRHGESIRRTAAPDGMVTTRTSAEARETAVQALHLVERGERSSLDGLRDAICVYLTLLRREGIPKADALEEIRALVATPTSNERTWLLPAAREALTDLATHWCTEQYTRE